MNQELRLDPAAERRRYLLHDNDFLDQGYQDYVTPMVDEVKKLIPKDKKGLDYGSGPESAIGYLLRDQGYEIEKYDPFFNPNPAALQATYDFILICEVVEHFYIPAEEFEKLRGMLNPGGMLFVMTVLRTEKTDFATWYYRRDPTHVCFYSEKSFDYIRRRFQFSGVKITPPRTVVLTTS